jgi:hypothetical protein
VTEQGFGGLYEVMIAYSFVDYDTEPLLYDLIAVDVISYTVDCAIDNFIQIVDETDAGYINFYVINIDAAFDAKMPNITDYVSNFIGVEDFCGPISYQIIVNKDNEDDDLDDVPDFITQTRTTYNEIIRINTAEDTNVGQYKIKILYTMDDYLT